MSDTPETLSLASADLNPDEMYLLLRDAVVPRPIAWVSSADSQGRPNIAPYSFFNVCSSEPPVVGFAVGPRPRTPASAGAIHKDTLDNVRATGEMVVNMVPESMLEAMVRTSANLAPGESEFDHAGLSWVPGESVRAPRLIGSPVAFECVLHQIVEIGTHHWVMGRVVRSHVDTRLYLGRHKGLDHRIDSMKVEALRPVGRLGRANYVRIRGIEAVLRTDGPND
jgi:flavin reductase (DIM6/NTAB) family NADH-FMN oxidoreductase RutF